MAMTPMTAIVMRYRTGLPPSTDELAYELEAMSAIIRMGGLSGTLANTPNGDWACFKDITYDTSVRKLSLAQLKDLI